MKHQRGSDHCRLIQSDTRKKVALRAVLFVNLHSIKTRQKWEVEVKGDRATC